MKTEIMKELRYALRSGRILILFASFLFFALLTPVMLKIVLPMVLSGQFSGDVPQAIGGLTDMTQLDCIRNYMEDVLQIGTIIIAFTLCGLTASEIRDNTWVLPLCSGKRFERMIGAKLLVFGTLLIFVPIIALLADYGYSGILYGFEIDLQPILFSGLLQGIYVLFLLSCLMMWGVLLKRPIPAGFMTLAVAFGIHFVSSLLRFEEWTPSGLLAHADRLTPTLDSALFIPLVMTVILIVLMLALTLSRLKCMEWNTRNV
jgi:ABC-type transport system involved in multi-copper enzyme maturation permease subunit